MSIALVRCPTMRERPATRGKPTRDPQRCNPTLRSQGGKLPAERLICSAANQYSVDHLKIGIITLDACANVIALNPEARDIVNERDGLAMAQRRLTPSDAAQMEFSTALKACLTAPNTQVAFGIRRPSGKRPYECVISQIRKPAGSVLKGYAVVFVTDSEQAWISSDVLASRYSLTPTEAALATIFARGKSVQQASEIMSIAQSTVRSHLKHLMHKVGVRRQAELAAALLRNPPVRHTNRLPN